jgi:capsular polysaccharide biosynthesis protein
MNLNEDIRLEDFKISFIAVLKKKMSCLAVGTLFLMISIFLTWGNSISDEYGASATVYSSVYNTTDQNSDAAAAMIAYADIVKSDRVCERAASLIGNADLTGDDIRRMLSVSASSSSVMMTITANSSDPDVAVEVANAVAKSFVIEMKTITQTDVIQQLDNATEPYLASNGLRNLWEQRIVFFLLGSIGMAAFYFLKELFSDKIRLAEQCAFDDEDVLLGIIPEIQDDTDR